MSILDKLDAIKVQINNRRETRDMYGMLDFKDKIVIDIGADYGITPRYFLSKGASRVICYEANPVLHRRLLLEMGNDNRIEINGSWNGVYLPHGDILKMDCEMCEYMIKEEQLQAFPQWAIGVHRPRRQMPKVIALQEMLIRNGGRIVADMGYEVLYVKG
jgi:hypothetical protein